MSSAPYIGFGDFGGFSLRFTATQAEPQFAKLFLATGGAINAAAGPGPTDFAVTGSKSPSSHQLKPTDPTEVCVPISNDIISFDDEDRIILNSCTKINACAQRVGAAINGTLVNTFAGAGSTYLSTFLRAASITEGSHYQLPLTYNTLASHSATVGCSMARIVDASGEPVNVHFVDDVEENEISAAAEAVVDAWAQGSWTVREKHILYKPSPTLTKTVAKVPVGTNDRGYELAHSVINRSFPFSLETLNSLLEHTIGAELGFAADEVKTFLNATANPGVQAADWMQTVAAACSTAANYLIPYRADGRTTVTTTGSGFTAVENWRPICSPEDGEDCDGSAMLAISMLNTANNATDEDKQLYPYVKAVANALNPYYSVAMCVVGASSAEASGAADGGSDGHAQIAGHAIALLVPNLGLARGLNSAEHVETAIHGAAKVGADVIASTRFTALFGERTVRNLPENERRLLAQGTEALEQIRGASLVPNAMETAAARLAKLQPFAIEGTTPSSPVLFMLDNDKRDRATQSAKYDQLALDKAAPNIGRSVKLLHVGGGDKHNPHRFYHDLVEITFPVSHPLYTDAGLRAIGKASTQYAFVGKEETALPVAAGVTPRQLVEGAYAITPLHCVDASDAAVLDYSHRISARDVMPHRSKPHQLSETQSKALKRSMSALAKLNTSSCDDEFDNAHAVTYHVAYASLINNPAAIEHLTTRIESAKVGSLVDSRIVKGLALNDTGAEAGLFAVISAVVPV